MGRESDAAGRARDQRVALARAVRTCARPHARHRQVGEDDRQRRRHIVLDVMRVADVQRGHGEEDRRRDRGAMIGQARRQPVERGNRGRAGRDAKRPAGRIDAGRVGEVQLLQRADGRDLAAQPHPRQIHSDPGEQHVEVERRIEKVVRVERPTGKAKRPRHDRDFVRVVHRGKAVLQADDAQAERERADERPAPTTFASAPSSSLAPGCGWDDGVVWQIGRHDLSGELGRLARRRQRAAG